MATGYPRLGDGGRLILVTDGRDNVGQPAVLCGLGAGVDVVLVGDDERTIDTDGRVFRLPDLAWIDDVVAKIASTGRTPDRRLPN